MMGSGRCRVVQSAKSVAAWENTSPCSKGIRNFKVRAEQIGVSAHLSRDEALGLILHEPGQVAPACNPTSLELQAGR